MTITVHLGAHRTASTHLQLSLAEARRGLLQAGVWYAGPDETRSPRFPLADALRPAGEGLAELARGVIAGAAELWPHVLISDENMVGGTGRRMLRGSGSRLYPGAPAQIGRLVQIAGQPLTLALAVREPAGFLASAFGLQVAYGNELWPAPYLGPLRPDGPLWSDLAQRLLAVPGVAGMIVWRHEDYRRLRPCILRRLLPAAAARAVGDPPAVNAGLSDRAYRALLEAVRADPSLTTRRAALSRLARKLKGRFPAGAGEAPALLGTGMLSRGRAAYADDVAHLATLPGVELIGG